MRIGIDAKWYYSGHPSGRLWTRHLVEQLLKHHTEHEYTLFLKSADRHVPFPISTTNAQFKYGSIANNLFSNLVAVPWLARNISLDLLLTNNFCSPFARCPQVVVLFDVIFESHREFFTTPERMYFSLMKPLTRLANHVVTISEYSKADLLRYGYVRSPEEVSVVHLGVAEEFLLSHRIPPDRLSEIRVRYGLPERFVLYVGRLNARKNVDKLLQAFAGLESTQLGLVLCGQSDGKTTEIGRMISQLRLGSRVKVLGGVPDGDLPSLYRCATVFAYVSSKEGFGLPPLEAMACGTPVVVAKTSSIPEVCGDAVEYVDPEDVYSVERALRSILGDEGRRAELARRGKERAKRFTWSATTDRLLEILKQVAFRK